MNGCKVRRLSVLLALAGLLALGGCDSGDKPKAEFIPSSANGSQTPCAVLAGLFPGYANGGIGTDTVTIDGTTYTDSATCDPIVTATVDPDTQDIQVNLLWGWIDPSKFFTNHIFISLWGRTLGLTTGPKDIVNYQSAVDAVNEFRYDSGGVDCQADTSGGPIPGGLNFTSIGAVGGVVAGSFTNIPLVVNSGTPPCPAATLTGSFSMTRDSDDMDTGSGSVASPISLTIGTPASGALTGGANQSGVAYFNFIPGVSSRIVSVTGATVDVNWQVFSNVNFITPIAGCSGVGGSGTASCTVSGLTGLSTYYLEVRMNNSGPGTSASGTFNVVVN